MYTLPGTEEISHGECPDYLSSQIITCLGNKRGLLDLIGAGVRSVHEATGKDRLVCYDVFSGSGIVARYLKSHAAFIFAGDLEEYSCVINSCYLTDAAGFPAEAYVAESMRIQRSIEARGLEDGFITEFYAPRDSDAIQEGERVFFSTRNARYIDTVRMALDSTPEELKPFFLGPLLSEVSIHANTSGVFKGFHRDPVSGKGKFGGSKGHALHRILGDIEVEPPVLSRHACGFKVLPGDAVDVCGKIGAVDLAYLDPPYNQHPYGSNYFMLNLVVDYRRPERISEVSGIPPDWKRSAFNSRRTAYTALEAVIAGLEARFILLSFNSEGFLHLDELQSMLRRYGEITVLEKSYNTFKGGRQAVGRSLYLREYLLVLEKA